MALWANPNMILALGGLCRKRAHPSGRLTLTFALGWSVVDFMGGRPIGEFTNSDVVDGLCRCPCPAWPSARIGKP